MESFYQYSGQSSRSFRDFSVGKGSFTPKNSNFLGMFSSGAIKSFGEVHGGMLMQRAS